MTTPIPPIQPSNKTGVLFVCLGNICRSPLAEVIFRDLTVQRGVDHQLDIDSCGTSGYHAGDDADPRSIQVAAANGLQLRHAARQLDPGIDFDRFHLLVPMDRQNMQEILRLGASSTRVRLMNSFDPRSAAEPTAQVDVPDPYYGGDGGFTHVFNMLRSSCAGLLDHVLSPKFQR